MGSRREDGLRFVIDSFTIIILSNLQLVLVGTHIHTNKISESRMKGVFPGWIQTQRFTMNVSACKNQPLRLYDVAKVRQMNLSQLQTSRISSKSSN
jgi:hypothetical protein